MRHLHGLLSKSKPSVVFITENWLSSKFKDDEIVADFHYSVLRFDRPGRKGGGVCCIFKSDIYIRKIEHCISIKAVVLRTSMFYPFSVFKFINVCRPPNSLTSDGDYHVETFIVLS